MTMKRKFVLAAMLMALLSVAWLGQTGKASAQTIHSPSLAPSASVTLFGCSFQTLAGFYLTAVGGGGRTTDVIESNRAVVNSWEIFALIDLGNGAFAIRTFDQVHFLTAVGEGGRTTDVIHSNATQIQAWEEFFVRCN